MPACASHDRSPPPDPRHGEETSLRSRCEYATASEVVAAGAGDSLKPVARLLVERRISAVRMVDGAGRVLGLVSEGDAIVKEQRRSRAAARKRQRRPRLPAPCARSGERLELG